MNIGVVLYNLSVCTVGVYIYVVRFLTTASYIRCLKPCSTHQGKASPLPPIEDLQRLHDLVKESSYETIWTLLKGRILIALADVIGADGRPLTNGYTVPDNESRRLMLQVSV